MGDAAIQTWGAGDSNGIGPTRMRLIAVDSHRPIWPRALPAAKSSRYIAAAAATAML